MAPDRVTVTAAGRDVTITHPGKVFFAKAGYTKLDLVRYYLAVADGALRGAGGRPMALKRYPDGADGEFFFQKRAPQFRPPWLETVELRFPSGRSAREIVLRDAAGLAWIAHLGCLDLNPHPVRAEDLEHPDELRIDLDPVPGVGWEQLRQVAEVAHEVLIEHHLIGFPKTSGSRGIHVNVRIQKRWTFDQVRRAALALARAVERRAPKLATSKWWKEERHGVFLDYNQNAKDRTVASAYSVRPTPDARVSMPLTWHELSVAAPEEFTLATVPALFGRRGDAAMGIDTSAGSLESLLELSARDEKEGLGDAPWPPHYQKQEGEPPRVQPSKRRAPATGGGAPRRRSKLPLIEIARAAQKDEALAGLEKWKARHPEAAALLEPADVLVDAMRGRYTTWTRIRLNLTHVPEGIRPPQEPLEVDYNPWSASRRAPKMRSSS
jgi:bifunctional non-homologous end joining protein LigD